MSSYRFTFGGSPQDFVRAVAFARNLLGSRTGAAEVSEASIESMSGTTPGRCFTVRVRLESDHHASRLAKHFGAGIVREEA